MLNERLHAAHAVRDAYVPLKRAVTDLSTQAGQCCAVMVQARQDAGLNRPGFGARPISLVARAAALIAEAESCLAEAHPELGRMIVEAGLEKFYGYDVGPDDTPPPMFAAEPRRLAAVA